MVKGVAALLLLSAAPVPAPVRLDAPRWAELTAAAAATHALPALHDRERFASPEYWEAADAQGGDCEDKALAARALLLAQGWPQAALRLALLWTEAGEYHAVLTVEVMRGGAPATYVIDSRFAWVVGWDALTGIGYRWDKRQGADGGWRRIVTP